MSTETTTKPVDERCEICAEEWEECWSCYGEDPDCFVCFGAGGYVPQHCCQCGGGEYDCQCCRNCGGYAGTCTCPIPVESADGTTKWLVDGVLHNQLPVEPDHDDLDDRWPPQEEPSWDCHDEDSAEAPEGGERA